MFRFTIRELLLLTVVVAMGVGWWIDRVRLANRAVMWESRAAELSKHLKYDGWEVEWPDKPIDGLYLRRDPEAKFIGRRD